MSPKTQPTLVVPNVPGEDLLGHAAPGDPGLRKGSQSGGKSSGESPKSLKNGGTLSIGDQLQAVGGFTNPDGTPN